LRTQQVIAYESGVVAVPDPFGGSYYIEELTDRIEREAMDYIRRIDEMGGALAAIEAGFPQGRFRTRRTSFSAVWRRARG
jgi:methylmalonyl-CoA mutase N-terminal domain/subunit